jgi:hypothetical protein
MSLFPSTSSGQANQLRVTPTQILLNKQVTKSKKYFKKILKSHGIRPIGISGMLFSESGTAFPGASVLLKSLGFQAF